MRHTATNKESPKHKNTMKLSEGKIQETLNTKARKSDNLTT